MKSIALVHKGEDYIKVEVNGKEYEVFGEDRAQTVEDYLNLLIKSIKRCGNS